MMYQILFKMLKVNNKTKIKDSKRMMSHQPNNKKAINKRKKMSN